MKLAGGRCFSDIYLSVNYPGAENRLPTHAADAANAATISLFMVKFIPYRLIRPHVSANGPEIFR